ncbi:10933_t:CDS:2 [Diversispora eburnea]|uniref:10933_t:CDS:1 n=1 Tax=Diversispora eburnea TaxID=1213867 RepID=A0A9N8VF84_9GLOM|nr:10933_t:CDS:2 [Diversispora eburnea]
MTFAGSILLENRNRSGFLINDNDVQEFEGLNFKIKIESIPSSVNNARLCFLDTNNNEISIPKQIICNDVSDNRNIINNIPFPGTQSFLIEHLHPWIFSASSLRKLFERWCYKGEGNKKVVVMRPER